MLVTLVVVPGSQKQAKRYQPIPPPGFRWSRWSTSSVTNGYQHLATNTSTGLLLPTLHRVRRGAA